MSKKAATQIIPFPLPPYLASYFAAQITASPLDLGYGIKAKPFSVSRDTAFGKFIFRCLSKTNRKPYIKDGYTFFIQVSENSFVLDRIAPDARYSFVEFKDSEIKEIIDVFKVVFETALFSYVAGSVTSYQNAVGKKKGYLQQSIRDFCKFYGVLYTDKNFTAWNRAIGRSIKKTKELKNNHL